MAYILLVQQFKGPSAKCEFCKYLPYNILGCNFGQKLSSWHHKRLIGICSVKIACWQVSYSAHWAKTDYSLSAGQQVVLPEGKGKYPIIRTDAFWTCYLQQPSNSALYIASCSWHLSTSQSVIELLALRSRTMRYGQRSFAVSGLTLWISLLLTVCDPSLSVVHTWSICYSAELTKQP